MICSKRVIDTFDKDDKRNVVKMPTENVEYYSEGAGFGYGMGELQMKKAPFSVKRKVKTENAGKC